MMVRATPSGKTVGRKNFNQPSPYIAERRQFLPMQLEQLNITMGDIDVVVISHLHLDHCGCLDFFRGTKAAQRGIIVHASELPHALKVTHRSLGFRGAYVKGE